MRIGRRHTGHQAYGQRGRRRGLFEAAATAGGSSGALKPMFIAWTGASLRRACSADASMPPALAATRKVRTSRMNASTQAVAVRIRLLVLNRLCSTMTASVH